MAENQSAEKETALITGASTGIGLEFARLFAREGYDLVLVARSLEKLNALAADLRQKYGRQVRTLSRDLAAPGAPGEIFEELESHGIHISVLINNAGIGMHGPYLDLDAKTEKQMLQLNIAALTELTRLFSAGMVRRGRGRILNVASTAAFQPGPLMAAYYASKAYVLHFSEALACEFKGTGVTVTTLCPGPTESHFQQTAGMGNVLLFRLFLMKAGPVAEAGYRGMLRGKSVVIPGLVNKLFAFSVRLGPRWLIPRIVRMLQGGRATRS